jgi:NTP pyrophosphatase (non-canonical NTP hydrolase)
MRFQEYQERAKDTDRLSNLGNDPIRTALLGLSGETGSVHTLFKKKLRDGDHYPGFREKVKEELGDVLWYLTSIATHSDISLEEVAVENLQKISSRWLPTGEDDKADFDEHFPADEQLPRRFRAEFRSAIGDRAGRIEVYVDGEKCGATLSDNAYIDDGYRFHDVFHMTCAAMLGWSPVFRSLKDRKRKSDPDVDEVEDGGRAIVIDEALAAFVFAYAIKHNFLEGIGILDWQLLDLCRDLVSGLEVAKRSLYDWEAAILKAFEIWRRVREEGSGLVEFDMENRTAVYSPLP